MKDIYDCSSEDIAIDMINPKTTAAAAAVVPPEISAVTQQTTSPDTTTVDSTGNPDDATQHEDGFTKAEELASSTKRSRTPPKAMDIDTAKPPDFEGELDTTNELPSPETLRKIDNYKVLDRMGVAHTFRSLYSGCKAARRVLVIFVRHFFCGACQEYLRSLSDSKITPEALPTNTGVVVIGCGDPGLIDMYAETTNCRFPIYTDPRRNLFNDLGMVKTLAMGSKPEYIKKSILKLLTDEVVQALKSPPGLAFKSGALRQTGGEFLFDVVTPITAPRDEKYKRVGSLENLGQVGAHHRYEDGRGLVGEKRVTWCHRMRTMRDHAEISQIEKVLECGKDHDDSERHN